MSLRLPDELPRALALLAGSATAAYLWLLTATGTALGIGSSTSALGYPFGLVYGGLVGVAAAAIGIVIRHFFPKGHGGLVVPVPVAILAVATTTMAGAFAGREVARQEATRRAPGILVDLGRLEATDRPDTTVAQGSIAALLVGGRASDGMTWDDRHLVVVRDSASITMTDEMTGRRLTLDLPGIGKVFRVDAAVVRGGGGGPSSLVLMILGAIRSHRAMLIVVDSTWQVVYRERLVRQWNPRPPTLTLWPLRDGDVVAVRVGRTEERVLQVRRPTMAPEMAPQRVE